jgi:hypothetical protein
MVQQIDSVLLFLGKGPKAGMAGSWNGFLRIITFFPEKNRMLSHISTLKPMAQIVINEEQTPFS